MKSPAVRFLATIVVIVVTAVTTVVILAIVDLYLSGHGYPSIRRELTGLGIPMSPADLLFLIVIALVAIVTWRALGGRPSRPT